MSSQRARSTPNGRHSMSHLHSMHSSGRRHGSHERRSHHRRLYNSSSSGSPYRSPSGNGYERFHYNETQPPRPERRSPSPRHYDHRPSYGTPHENRGVHSYEGYEYDEDYKTPLVRSPERGRANSPPRSSRRKLRLRVRVEGVRDLVPPTRTPPSTFITIHTAYGRGRTPVIQNDANPPFNDEFVFDVRNPEREEVEVTVVAITPNGRKRIGQCVLSPWNLLVGVERRVWVQLVRHPGTERAYEQGQILVSLYTNAFGAQRVPPPEAECEFREKVRNILKRNAPEEIHRLEWYVGKCMDDYHDAYVSLRKQFHRQKSVPASFQITVKSVTDLAEENGTPTPRETCYVRVMAGGARRATKTVPYHKKALINETFDMTLMDARTGTITLSVFSANHKFGECLLSLAGIQKGVPRERTHKIVFAAGTGDACYSGNITVILRSKDFGSNHIQSDVGEIANRLRVQHYLWKYLRDDLHRLDPIMGSINDINLFMQNWTRDYGPEPQQHSLKIRMKSFQPSIKNESKVYSVIVRVGPEMYRTKSVRGQQDFIFEDETELRICSPEKDELTFIIVNETDDKDTEAARAVISLRNMPLGEQFHRNLKVFRNALTADAEEYGMLSIEGLADNFGKTRASILPAEKEKYYRQRVEALLSRYDPAQMHRVGYLLGDYTGREDQLMKDLTDTYGPETGSTPMNIRILGIRDFTLGCSCYVKAYLDGVSTVRTTDHYPSSEIKFSFDMKNEASVPLKNPQHSQLTFKVGEHRWTGSRVLGTATMSLRNLVRNEPNISWVPVITDTGKDEIGVLGVELQSSGFTKGIVTMYKKPENGTRDDQNVLNIVTKDVTSLLRKYRPQDLSQVQPLIASTTSLKVAHSELRRKIATQTVIVTFYVNIQRVEMIQEEDKTKLEKGNVMVKASCKGDSMSSSLKTVNPNSINARKYYPEIRIDIPVPAEPIDVTSAIPLEIFLFENVASTATTRTSTVNADNRITYHEREMGRTTLSLRALFTRKVFNLGEAVTVPVIRTYMASPSSKSSRASTSLERNAIIADLTLSISTPAFEIVPRWFRFNQRVMRRFHREYVRYYYRRIVSFFRTNYPWQLRDIHYTLYERDVASGRWPLSLYDWLIALIKLYGPEKNTSFGPPPKLPFDPETEELERMADGSAVRASMFHSSTERGSTQPSTRYSRGTGHSTRIR